MNRLIKFFLLILSVIHPIGGESALREAAPTVRMAYRGIFANPRAYMHRRLPARWPAADAEPRRSLHPVAPPPSYYPRAPRSGGSFFVHGRAHPRLPTAAPLSFQRNLHSSAMLRGEDSAPPHIKSAFDMLSSMDKKVVYEGPHEKKSFQIWALYAASKHRIDPHVAQDHSANSLSPGKKKSKFRVSGKEAVRELIRKIMEEGNVKVVMRLTGGDESRFVGIIVAPEVIGLDKHGKPTYRIRVVVKKEALLSGDGIYDKSVIILDTPYILTAYPIENDSYL